MTILALSQPAKTWPLPRQRLEPAPSGCYAGRPARDTSERAARSKGGRRAHCRQSLCRAARATMASAVFALLVLSAALARTASSPAAANGTRSQLEVPKASPGTPGTPGTPKLKLKEEEVWSTLKEGEQAERTLATTIQARRGRATSSPTKKVPRPCPGCFSVIGDPPMMRMG